MLIKPYHLFSLILLVCFVTACTSTRNSSSDNFIILDYADFGPQDIAEELIGPSYWQWDKGQYSKPQQFDVKVIVYRGINLNKVKEMFPVDKINKKDFRYVHYLTAISWHDERINYFNEELANNLGDKNISFYILRTLYTNSLKIERTLRK